MPPRLPDLFAGSPLLILGRYRGAPEGPLRDPCGRRGGRALSSRWRPQCRDNPAIAAAWARGRSAARGPIRRRRRRPLRAGAGDRGDLAEIPGALPIHGLCRGGPQHGRHRRLAAPDHPAGRDARGLGLGDSRMSACLEASWPRLNPCPGGQGPCLPWALVAARRQKKAGKWACKGPPDYPSCASSSVLVPNGRAGTVGPDQVAACPAGYTVRVLIRSGRNGVRAYGGGTTHRGRWLSTCAPGACGLSGCGSDETRSRW